MSQVEAEYDDTFDDDGENSDEESSDNKGAAAPKSSVRVKRKTIYSSDEDN